MSILPYGYCGMPCALCTRYRTEGASRCPGCSAGGYYTDVCKVHHCCQGKALAHCGACVDYPCPRLGKMGDFRDLNTGHVKQRTCETVAKGGLGAWQGEYERRAALLDAALRRYNNGRMKRYLCELFIRRDVALLEDVMRRAEHLTGDAKELGRGFRHIAEEELAQAGEQG